MILYKTEKVRSKFFNNLMPIKRIKKKENVEHLKSCGVSKSTDLFPPY